MNRRWAIAWLLSALMALVLGVLLVSCAPGPSTPSSMGGPQQSGPSTTAKMYTYKLELTSGKTEYVSCQAISHSGEATYIMFDCFENNIALPKDSYMVTEFHLVKE